MSVFVLCLFLAICAISTGKREISDITSRHCYDPDLKKIYRNTTLEFVVPLYKAIASHTTGNLVVGLHSVWMLLAAIAEGCNHKGRQEIFQVMKLTYDRCIREQFYQIATARISLIKDVRVINIRNLFVDECLALDPLWLKFVSFNNFLDIIKAPMKSHPVLTATKINQELGLNLTGNSVILDAFGYNAKSTTAFEGAVIERSPFYNQEGEVIGSVDLMRVKRQARMGYVRSLKAKVLEIPGDSNGFYLLLVLMFVDNEDIVTRVRKIKSDIIDEIFDSLKKSDEPFDIAVPRMELTSQIDMRKILEILGIKKLWTDPKYTEYISAPPAFPTSYLHRAIISLGEKGTAVDNSTTASASNNSLGLDPRVGTDFIANKPFWIGLYDAETRTPLLAARFFNPIYPKDE